MKRTSLPLLATLKRREFILTLGGAAAAWPLAARAQQPEPMRRIAVLTVLPENDPENKARLEGFTQGLEGLGWSEGRNAHMDYYFGVRTGDAEALASAIVASQPDVIFVQSTPFTTALQRQTRALPIVFVGVADPVGSGFIASLARPGGNLTGFMLYEASVAGKWLAMLKEIAFGVTRAGLMYEPGVSVFYLHAAEALAPSLAIELVPSPIENAADIEHAIESCARIPNSGLIVAPNLTAQSHRDLLITLTARYRLPTVYSYRPFVSEGGLMSYHTDNVEMFRQGARYVDRILRGAKPADLPVQTPTRYETVLNLKTAKALGLDVPPSLLVRADEVIE
jgi:putative ABC transport system substrate-binding protein